MLSSELFLWMAPLFELRRLFIFGLETRNLEFPKPQAESLFFFSFCSDNLWNLENNRPEKCPCEGRTPQTISSHWLVLPKGKLGFKERGEVYSRSLGVFFPALVSRV